MRPALSTEGKAKKKRQPRAAGKVEDELRNHEIVVVALYLVGGGKAAVDTEDVAVRVNEIAPGRFVWKKYPEQINLEAVRVFLSDAKKPKNGELVMGSGREGWRLTRAGLAFAKKGRRRLPDAGALKGQMTPRERTWRRAERARLLGTEAVEKYLAGDESSVTPAMAEEFFRVDEYVSSEARDRKIVRLLDAFGDDAELGRIVRVLQGKVRTR